jgi:GT2 family glycosyltransferase
VWPPRVLVLVLNYNAGPALEPCLRSLQAATYGNFEIVVLDNGSTDGSLDSARSLGLEVHEFGSNLGYCAAYNRAFEMHGNRAEFYLLSNADLIVPSPTIERMVRIAVKDESVGFVGPIQRHEDTRDIRSAGIRWRCGRLPVHVTRAGEPYDAVEGAFVLVRKAVLARVGGLDETFALNLEDVEWQTRSRKGGFRPTIATEAEILHRPPGAVRRHTGAYFQARNICFLTARNCDPGDLFRIRTRLYLEGLAGRVLGRPRAPYLLEGLRDFRRGVTGMRSFP